MTWKHMGVAIAAALGLGAVSTCVFGFLYLIVGAMTGVTGICSVAPHWWDVIYRWLSLVVVAAGVCGAIVGYQICSKKLMNRDRESDSLSSAISADRSDQ